MNCNSKITHDKNCNIVIQEGSYDNNYVYAYILQLNRTEGVTTEVFIKTDEEEEVSFKFNSDGFYTLVTLKVPKDSGEYYYSNGKFYHYYNEIELAELIEINPEVSHLDLTYEYYMLTYRLRKCYIDVCYLIFDLASSLNCNKSNLNSNLIYRRDLLWSALNVIKFMVELDLFEEAERLLERIMGCNGLCNNGCEERTNPCNCGCS